MIPLPKPKMSAVDVVDFVVEYFSADPARRSLNPHVGVLCGARCLYCGEGGRLCAFALFVRETDLCHLVENESASENLCIHGVLLRPEVEHLSFFGHFWDEVQVLHDSDCMWDNRGLTPVGEAHYRRVRRVADDIEAQNPTWMITQPMLQLYVCDNCGCTEERENLPNAKDLHQRLVPGGIYTDKECPACGALCFPKTVEHETQATHDVL